MSNRRSPKKPWLAIRRRPNVADQAWHAHAMKRANLSPEQAEFLAKMGEAMHDGR